MSSDSIKSDLQQILNSDVALRKEFNELKRSLSDYRNQLIMRDEDCKRLQVTIDVLNTKLAVMERDNTTYKGELQSFKELRGSIKEQLQAKQEEIDLRLSEINSLKEELTVIASSYENKIETIQTEASNNLSSIASKYEMQLNELRSNTHYKEAGIREEYELRLNEISNSSADKEQQLQLAHQETLVTLTSNYENELSNLKSKFEQYQADSFSSHNTELDTVKHHYEQTIRQIEDQFVQKLESLEYRHANELNALKLELEDQRHASVSALRDELNSLKETSLSNESLLKLNYETKLNELQQLQLSSSESLMNRYTSEIENLNKQHEGIVSELKSQHELHLNALQTNSSDSIQSVINEYEEKLSNTLIHSNSQNTKLTEALSAVQLENDHFKEKIREMVIHIDSQNTQFESLTNEVRDLSYQLESKVTAWNELNASFESYKTNSQENESEQIQHLRDELDTVNTELVTIVSNLEGTTNLLAETENKIDAQNIEIAALMFQISDLNSQLELSNASISEKETLLHELNHSNLNIISEKEEAWNALREELEINNSQSLKEKEVEFQKLLAENTNLINEIDLAQDKVDAQESELHLLKAELEELQTKSEGRVRDLRDTLNAKNFEMTALEANHAVLQIQVESYKNEITLLSNEVSHLNEQLNFSSQSSEQFTALQHNYDVLLKEKQNLISEISEFHNTINTLNETVVGLNQRIQAYDSETSGLKDKIAALESGSNSASTTSQEEQDAFIDRLFKQIDILNDERMTLLNEKEAMANQLLKMNEVVSEISQEVDSQNINVSDLTNHRRNIILASSSEEGQNERRQMKTQINELLREIDKCIALLSA
jgi:chromosome segregation ATPase